MVVVTRPRRTQKWVRHLTRDESRALFDRQVRRYLGISGEEFLKKWDAGEYGDNPPPEARRLVMLMPFGR